MSESSSSQYGVESTVETSVENVAQSPVQRNESWEQAAAKNGIDGLPSYTRSLLRITIPAVVTLAQRKQRLSSVLELQPGTIIQFEKSCRDMLELEVDNQHVAVGEAVKVGDKFGLRVTSIVLPEERFHPVPRSAITDDKTPEEESNLKFE